MEATPKKNLMTTTCRIGLLDGDKKLVKADTFVVEIQADTAYVDAYVDGQGQFVAVPRTPIKVFAKASIAPYDV